ncbi:hypothetical protein N7676_15815 [Stenotrophomonas sp. GD03993]|uniref:DUF6573 family protein n=1 Tax=unclassified Stenotrophomonas TaxID=196198 RepID=UPI00244780E7|nr:MULTISPECIES: DUF6573 family protein [unclassified Stenotrophomonas]MDH0190253.1 hypothetical protein [Stenotrophomonas sp. GD04051]MDH0465273.1 hypothetical protein [Stenotrophomonas sp. GD03993]MDH0877882.1 hypothetical protein [Stenotrophomonas sp. GD03877]
MNNEATPNTAVAGTEGAGFWDGFTVIDAVTRADLLADGSLIDASETARKVGIKMPLAVSAAAWASVASDDAAEQDATLFRMLMTAKFAAFATYRKRDALFDFDGAGLYMHIGPGDTLDPVLTIMVQGED